MFQTGLVSISFRKHTVEEIIGAVRGAGLQALEWGSDVHVPAGDEARAKYVRTLTEQNGLTTAAYGSYYRLGAQPDPVAAFAPYLTTAALLGAPVIRIWGGSCGSAALTEAQFQALVKEGRLLAEQAASYGIVLSLECHNNTLTDDYTCALRYMNAVNHPAMRMYWQPNQNRSEEYNLDAARALAPFVTNIHVFSWEMADGKLMKYPLAHGAGIWHRYLEIFRAAGGDHALLLEFMHDDRIESLAETANELHRWGAQLG